MIHYSHIALGANIASGFASNSEDLRSALVHGAHALLREAKLKSLVASSLYDTSPMGAPGRQPRYVNALLRVETSLSAGQLLRLVKRIEVAAGRRKRGLNGPRPLDIDIIDFGGRRLGWPARRADAQLQALASAGYIHASQAQ